MANLFRFLKRPTDAPIIVASMGRAGSTLVYHAIRKKCRNPRDRKFIETLAGATFERGTVYKTHDFPDALQGQDVKVVFLYSSASDSAKSVYNCRETKGAKWIEQHLRHLKSSDSIGDLFNKDILRIGDQIDAWTTCTHTPVLGLRYETLWENVDVLREFTGLRIRLPKKESREPKNLPAELEAKCHEAYAALDARIAAMPDFFLTQGER